MFTYIHTLQWRLEIDESAVDKNQFYNVEILVKENYSKNLH